MKYYLQIGLLFIAVFTLRNAQANLALMNLVIACPADKSETFSPGCTFEVGDYTGEVSILESEGAVFINQIPAPGSFINQTTQIQIIVTDNGDNVQTCFFTITLPPLPQVTITTTRPFCNGGVDGAAFATVTNGQPPYSYQWTTGATSPTILGLAAGSYGVTVTDANGCTALQEATISQPSKVVLSLNVYTFEGGHNVSSKEATDGSATASATGGTPPYAWLWSTGDNTSAVSGLGVGDYWIVVTDANGCVDTMSFKITPPFVVNIPVAISPNGDGLNDVFAIEFLEDYPENELIIFNRWGDIVYKTDNYQNDWNGTSTAALQIGKNELPDGVYFYQLNIKNEPPIKGSVILKRK